MQKISFLVLLFLLTSCGDVDPNMLNIALTDTDTKQSEEQAKALAAAAALQDASNQAQQIALQKFGTGQFGQSTFQ
ncbi:MAG: hypothetical protein VYC50_04415 [Pseudomonadota bacterium]|nr:hypothetical protein [Pseudomonadota bacterium]|tara:strand:- start:901 stop:1128 length:228 start_codon:yes stop_codon:yes gene_type:complete